VFYRLRGRLLLAAALAGTAFLLWPRSPLPGQPTGEPRGKPAVAIEYNGVSSCASMACHHFNGATASLRSEYSTWAGDDKHARAFAVLYNDRSARIMRNLVGGDSVHATAYALCLKCHSTNDGRTDNAHERFVLADGVGCESCHGPSQKYLTEHFKPGFKELSAREKADRFGMWPTKDLTFRARLCVTCHVGDSTKEVNHDLIAAGHPRLNFELAGYHGIYNKHWAVEPENGRASEKARHPDYYARLWLLGQAVTSRGAVDLLVSRAEGSIVPPEKTGKPWPEFAEYACYACHKDLQVNSPRQRVGYAGRHPGAFPYGSWYLTALSPLSGASAFAPKEVEDDVDSLKKAMQQPGPSAARVADIGKGLSGRLGSLIEKVEKTPFIDNNQLLGYMRSAVKKALEPTGRKVITDETAMPVKTRDGARIDEMDWDEATQLYLSLAALSQELSARGAKEAMAIRPDMLEFKARLKEAFPAGYDSPKGYDPVEKKGARSLKEHLESIRSLLGS
jgi:hypothetical protein